MEILALLNAFCILDQPDCFYRSVSGIKQLDDIRPPSQFADVMQRIGRIAEGFNLAANNIINLYLFDMISVVNLEVIVSRIRKYP